MRATNKILVILTSTDQYEKVGYRTGLWLSEFAHFWDEAETAGYQMSIASPQGGQIPIDPESLINIELGQVVGLKGKVSKLYEDRSFMNLLNNTLKISDVSSADYDALYLAGGHGAMFDFSENQTLSKLTAQFYEDGKIVSAVCHGPCGLLNVKLSNGDYLIRDKKVTAFSWREEVVAKRDTAVPYNLEAELKKRGAKYDKAIVPFKSHVVVDGHLITGQNPDSTIDVARSVIRMLALKGDQSVFHRAPEADLY